MVLMLCSPASSYMTGQTYHLDGGCLAGGTPWDFDTKYGAAGPAVTVASANAVVTAGGREGSTAESGTGASWSIHRQGAINESPCGGPPALNGVQHMIDEEKLREIRHFAARMRRDIILMVGVGQPGHIGGSCSSAKSWPCFTAGR